MLSTGIGGPSTAIAIEELRQVGVNTLIRIGSCGALQDSLALGDVIIAHGAVADDGASKTYAPASYPACADPYLTATLIQQAKQMNISAVCGLVRSHDSFYTDREAELDAEWSGQGSSRRGYGNRRADGGGGVTRAAYRVVAKRGRRA